jgi:hypothetical protein
MVNNSWAQIRVSVRQLTLVVAVLLAPPLNGLAVAATKYKKSTSVDFEGSMVEGKSRKPYSAYLTQQKDSAFSELHQWQPDLNKSLLDAQTKLDKTQ